MPNKRRNNILRWIANVLLCAGALMLGVWGGSLISMKIWQHRHNLAFDRNRNSAGKSVPTGGGVHVEDGDIIGRLSVPRLHVEAMIREGTSSPTLSVALGHIPGTAMPGQPGNIGVAGHRDTLFRGLRNVKKRDEIVFETSNATYRYRVEDTQIVKPQDVGVLKPGSKRELTLVTCYPFYYVGEAPDRFIVKAQLETNNGSEAAVAASSPRPTFKSPETQTGRVSFDVKPGHSRELIPGRVWLGVDSTDATDGTVNGWLWVMPDRRTVWLHDTTTHDPVFFDQDGKTRELLITGITDGSARGSMMVGAADRENSPHSLRP